MLVVRQIDCRGIAPVLTSFLTGLSVQGKQRSHSAVDRQPKAIATQDLDQIIITCQNAARKYMFSSFTEVELADFNHKQIKCFAENWFVAVAQNHREAGFALAEDFMEKLNKPKNQRIRELAVTRLFLHPICLVFQEDAEFPPEVVKLYEHSAPEMG